jgi:hypothetical protein
VIADATCATGGDPLFFYYEPIGSTTWTQETVVGAGVVVG